MENKSYIEDPDEKGLSKFNNLESPKKILDEHKKNIEDVGVTIEQKISPIFRQYWAASVPILGMIICGLTMGYSAVLLPQLESMDSLIKTTKSNSSWIAAMAALSMAPGGLIGIFCMERYGRKKCILLNCVPSMLGWIMFVFAQNFPMLLVGRFFTGLAVGIFGPPAPVTIGETSLPKYRGMLLAAITLANTSGILFTHILGTFLTWRMTAAVCSIFPCIMFLLTLTIPETPSWLMAHDRIEDSERSLKWLRGDGPEFTTEFENMLKKHETAEKVTIKSIWSNIKKPQFYRALPIVLFFFLVMQCSGINVITFYTVTIMTGIFKGSVNEYLSMIIIDTTRVVMSVLGCILARKFKRRTLTIIAGIGAALSIYTFSGFSYIVKQYPEVLRGYSWISLIFLIFYICFIHSGIYSVPFVLKGEYFPQETRGVGSGVTSLCNFMFIFLAVKPAPYLFSLISIEGTFALYGLAVLVGSSVLYFWMIESKNKTLLEIEEEFQRLSKKI